MDLLLIYSEHCKKSLSFLHPLNLNNSHVARFEIYYKHKKKEENEHIQLHKTEKRVTQAEEVKITVLYWF